LEITTELGRNPDLEEPGDDFIAELHAEGGLQPYEWKLAPGSIPPQGIQVEKSGRIHRKAAPGIRRATLFTVQCKDGAGYIDTASFAVKVGHPGKLWFGRRSKVSRISITVKPSLRSILFRTSNYLAVLGFTLPAFGALWIAVYAFTTPGRPG
jgi:hypothetical protein